MRLPAFIGASRARRWVPWIALLFLLASLPATARTQLRGKVLDEQGEAVGGITLHFVPAADSSEMTRKLKVKKNGTFQFGFFPSGSFTIECREKDWFLGSLSFVIIDPSGLEVDRGGGQAHPTKGLPPVRLPYGTTVELTLVLSAEAKRRELTQQVGVQEASGRLQSVVSLLEQQQSEQALAEVDRVLEEQPELGAAHYLRGQALWRLGRLSEAAPSLRRAWELDPAQPGVPGALGSVLLQQGEKLVTRAKEEEARPLFEEALRYLDLQLERNPDLPALRTNRAVALERLGREEELIAELRRLLDLAPEDLRARMRLADLLNRAGRRDEALAVLAEVPAGEPETAKAIFNVAVGLYNEGNAEAAILAGEKAAEIDPQLAPVYRLLGRARIQLGDREGAVRDLKRFLELAPDDPQADVERQLLDSLGG